MDKIRSSFKNLTLEDLREWAGSKIYNRGKDYVACVSQVSRIEDGTLVAWVSGTDEYATSVRHLEQGEFDHDCTCPYDDVGPCKHAVAVLLAASEQMKRHQDIPLLDQDDALYHEAFGEDEENWLDDDDNIEMDDFDAVAEQAVVAKSRSPRLESMLADKNREELQALLMDLARNFPEVSRRLRDMMQLETGQVDQLVRSLRKEIRRLTAEDVWCNPWKEEGNLPDYSHVEEQLEALLAKGHADAVLELGEELWSRGVVQVEESQDEGETALTIASCLAVVMRALPRTSLTPSEQLLWLIEHELKDEYGLLDGADEILGNRIYREEDWRQVSIVMKDWLDNLDIPKSGKFTATYQREKIVNWLRSCYQYSGETQKIIPLLEQEADRCRSYDLLVKTLLDSSLYETARQWCIRGFNQTIVDAPGIAAKLQTQLRKLAENEKRFDLAAAYLAEDFFDNSSESRYRDLRLMTQKIEVWPAVREAVLDYLYTGVRPLSGNKGNCTWPLPEPEVKKPQAADKFRYMGFPNREMLIDIAILENRYDDAVSIYQEMKKNQRWGWDIDEKLANAIVESHPDMALQIWLSIAERLIAEVKPKAYEQAAPYLRRMQKVYEQAGRLTDWTSLLRRLRLEHKAKRRLIEVLDGLEKNRKLVGEQMKMI